MSQHHAHLRVRETESAPRPQRSRAPRGLRKFLAGLATVALVSSGAVLTSSTAALAAGPESGTVTGTVFRDFNSNGIFDSGNSAASGIANDIGLAGVEVKAYDRDGDLVGSAVSGADATADAGAYTLEISGAASADLRLEFASADPFDPAFAGADNGTSVQFVQIGATEVDYAVNAPGDYSSAALPVVTTVYSAGTPDSKAATGANANADWNQTVVAIPWAAQRTEQANGSHPNRNLLANFSEVGAVGTNLVDSKRDRVLAAAGYKRHSGLKATIDTIFMIPVEVVDVNVAGAGSVKSLARDGAIEQLQLNGLPIVGTSDTLDLGTALTNAQRDLAEPSKETADRDAFERAAKIGIGGMSLGTDGDTLFFTNLNDKNLYALDLADPTEVRRVELQLDIDERVWAVTQHHGDIYIGVVTTGETAAGAQPGIAASEAGLFYTVLRASEASVLGGSPTWAVVSGGAPTGGAVSNLGYVKGNVLYNWGGVDPSIDYPGYPGHPQIVRWNTWTDSWSWGSGATAGSVGFEVENSSWGPSGWSGNRPQIMQVYPQPILSGITFDTDGFMQLGFGDRSDLQGGNRNLDSDGTPGVQYESVASGDLLIAGPNADRSVFSLESNGEVSGYPYGAERLDSDLRAATLIEREGEAQWSGQSNVQGPGGREFYADSQDRGLRVSSTNHWENTLGSVVTIPGVDQVLSTSYDPLARERVTGLNWFSTENGAVQTGYVQSCSTNGCYDDIVGLGSLTFQKGGGIGAVSLRLEEAPLQVGNRVWFDADQDGVQDADEPGIDGVTVRLLDSGGNEIASTTTANGGEYYFDVDPNTEYTVEFVTPTTGSWAGGDRFGNVPWADLALTVQGAGDNPAIDSNPNPAGQATVFTGNPGENDHTIDAGYVADVEFTVQKLLADGSALPAEGQTFTAVVAANDFRGDALSLPQTEFEIEVGETTSLISVPVGSAVKVTEAGDFDHVIAGPAGVTPDAGGFFPLLGGAAAAFAFTMTNDLPQPGTLQVSKAVTGGDLSEAPLNTASFTVNYSWEDQGGGSGQLVLDASNGFTATIDPVPAGATVKLTELTPAPVLGYTWGAPTWSVGGQADGSALVPVAAGAEVQVTLTNTAVPSYGDFQLTKTISDEDAWGVLPDDFAFPIEYSLDSGASWHSFGITAADPTASLTWLLVGSQVWLREGLLAEHPDPSFEWTGHAFEGVGVVPHETEPNVWVYTVQQGSAEANALVIENTVNELFGSFAVLKRVSGPGASLADPTQTFQVQYRYIDSEGALQTRTSAPFTVGTAEQPEGWSSEEIPAGTQVYVTEVVPTGGLPEGANWGQPVMTVGGDPLLSDDTGEYIVIGDDTTVVITLENPVTVEPDVEIRKGDGNAADGTIVHDADTVTESEVYAPGETRDIVIRVENPGPEPLREVVLTDVTRAGGEIIGLNWAFPDGTTTAANWDAATATWSAQWAATHEPGTAQWAVGDVIIGTATLTLDHDNSPHQNRATVNATGALSGTPVSDENDYNAFTSAIQVIKYDGNKADPAVKDVDGSWITPAKPLADEDQDANDADHAVLYPVGEAQPVRWVVTNTGSTWLTNISLSDVTDAGPAIGDDWTADLSAFVDVKGDPGPSDYSFTTSGSWAGLLPPGASFFAEGSLTIDEPGVEHANTVTVIGNPIVPATGDDGTPTDQPARDGNDQPVLATDESGVPIELSDDDPFNAKTLSPEVQISKGDGDAADGTIAHEADTMAAGEAYQPGETRDIVFTVTNSGTEPLVDVELRDATVSGGQITAVNWELPDGTVLASTHDAASGDWVANWDGPWAPGEIITGVATLTVLTADQPHVDRASVTATGQSSGVPVEASNDYNAFTGSIQVIKYDGNKPDPAVKAEDGSWIIPTKPLADAEQDANSASTAVEYPVGTTNTVRWVVTNTGTTWLTDLRLTDVTGYGPDVVNWTCDLEEFGGDPAYDFANPWSGGLLAPGASFFCEGELTLGESETHQDEVTVIGTVVVPAVDEAGEPTGDPLIENDEPVRATIEDPENPGERVPFDVRDEDPFNAWTGEGPHVVIEKYDTEGTPQSQDADTMGDAQFYAPGETRTIEFAVTNNGDEALREVTLSDTTLSGASVEQLRWTLPRDFGTRDAVFDETTGVWSFDWAETFGDGDASWLPGETIVGTATLTVLASDQPHVNRTAVNAVGAGSGIPVSDEDDYNALSAEIQVIKYDGNKPDPIVKDADGNWVIPQKPLVDAGQDANSSSTSVQYGAGEANTVRWVVTNTGTTWLTELDLRDLTERGPQVERWTADLSAFGGSSAYDFVNEGTWYGLLPPGASFFAEGTLTLAESAQHTDTVTVEATPIVPEVDENGVPTGEPEIGPDGPELVTVDGERVRVTDSDPFNAHTGLVVTGGMYLGGAAVLGLLLLGAGALLMLRRKRAEAPAVS